MNKTTKSGATGLDAGASGDFPCIPGFLVSGKHVRLHVSPLYRADFISTPTNRPHSHPGYYELCVVEGGYGRFHHGIDDFALRPGFVFISDPRVPHEIESTTTRDLRLVFFILRLIPAEGQVPPGNAACSLSMDAQEEETCGNFLERHGHSIHLPEIAGLLRLLPEGRTGLDSDSRARRHLAIHSAWQIVLRSLHELARDQENSRDRSSGPSDGSFERAAVFMDTMSNKPVSVVSVARAAGVSARQLQRIFATRLGRGVREEIERVRLSRAAQMLLMNLSCKEVAAATGFGDQSTFTRRFKARFGLSPSRWVLNGGLGGELGSQEALFASEAHVPAPPGLSEPAAAFLFGCYDIPDESEVGFLVSRSTLRRDDGILELTERHPTLALLPLIRRCNSAWPEADRHGHDFLELIYVLGGSGSHRVGGLAFPLECGDIHFLEPALPHRIESVNEELVYANIAFRPEVLDPGLGRDGGGNLSNFLLVDPFFRNEDDNGGRFTPDPRAFERLARLAYQLCDSFRRSGYVAGEEVRSLFRVLLLGTIRERGLSLTPSPGEEAKRRIVSEIVAVIDDRLVDGFRVEDVARAAGIGYTRAAALFKEIRGETIVDYAKRRRVEMARVLLESTGHPVLRVAFDCGFNDLAYFNRVFKEETGATPGEYRRSVEKAR